MRPELSHAAMLAASIRGETRTDTADPMRRVRKCPLCRLFHCCRLRREAKRGLAEARKPNRRLVPSWTPQNLFAERKTSTRPGAAGQPNRAQTFGGTGDGQKRGSKRKKAGLLCFDSSTGADVRSFRSLLNRRGPRVLQHAVQRSCQALSAPGAALPHSKRSQPRSSRATNWQILGSCSATRWNG